MPQPVVHFELWSEKSDELAKFYSSVFDWNIRLLPQMSYHLVENGEGPGIGGGIMTPQKGPWPGNMTLYIDVDDIPAYREKIVAAGGKIIVDEMDVPGVGSLLLFLDPDERPMGIWKQTDAPLDGGG